MRKKFILLLSLFALAFGGCGEAPSSIEESNATLEEIVADIALPTIVSSNINQLVLKTKSKSGSTIIWHTENDKVVNHLGNVYHSNNDQEVILTANISYLNDVYSEDFPLTVKASGKVDFKNIHYQLKGEFKEVARRVDGEMTITFTSDLNEELDCIYFNLYTFLYGRFSGAERGSIVIESVKKDEQSLIFVQERYSLKIILLENFLPNETMTLKIDFQVNVPSGQERLGCYDKTCSITQWYPILAKYNEQTMEWNLGDYPILGESDYVVNAKFDLDFTYPSKYTGSSGGIDEEEVLVGDRKILKSHLENGRHMVLIFSEYFQKHITESDQYKIRYFYDTRTTALSTVKAFEKGVLGAVTFFEEKCGEFIYAQEFDIIETRVYGFAMEYSGLIQMGQGFNYYAYSGDYSTIVHELGHQWFYGKIGSDSGKDPFIDEGFNTFITAYYFTSIGRDNDLGLSSNKNEYTSYSRFFSLLPIGESMAEYDLVVGTIYSLSVYYGTATLLYEMMNVLGTEKIDLLLKEIADQYSYDLMTRNELFLIMQETLGIGARQAFEECIDNVYEYGNFRKAYN